MPDSAGSVSAPLASGRPSRGCCCPCIRDCAAAPGSSRPPRAPRGCRRQGASLARFLERLTQVAGQVESLFIGISESAPAVIREERGPIPLLSDPLPFLQVAAHECLNRLAHIPLPHQASAFLRSSRATPAIRYRSARAASSSTICSPSAVRCVRTSTASSRSAPPLSSQSLMYSCSPPNAGRPCTMVIASRLAAHRRHVRNLSQVPSQSPPTSSYQSPCPMRRRQSQHWYPSRARFPRALRRTRSNTFGCSPSSHEHISDLPSPSWTGQNDNQRAAPLALRTR